MGSLQNISAGALVAGFVFGVFGFFIFKYGKQESNGKRMILGLILMVYGYFVPNPWAAWAIGIILVFLNYRWRWIDE